MLKLCKFYRYLIYRIYHFANDTPGLNVILTLSIVHFTQFLSLLTVVNRVFFPEINLSPSLSKLEMYIFMPCLFFLHFILFYNKKKWKIYFKEFRNETKEERKRGFILVLSYLIGSIVASFGIMILVCELFPVT